MKKNHILKTNLTLFAVFMLFSVFNSPLSAQDKTEVLDPSDAIEVSETLFKSIQDWQALGTNQTIPLDVYLVQSSKQEVGIEDKVAKIIKGLKGIDGATSKGTECNCVMVTVNSSYDIAPSYSYQYSPPENQGGLTTWYKEQIYGAATRQRLKLNSPSTNNEYEHEESITGDQVSSNSYARLSFNYLCTNGSLLPEDCGCSKTIFLKSAYYSKSWVSTSATGGWGTHSCFAAVEDDVALFTIDQYGADTNVTVLKGGQFQLSRAQDDTWNPEFWMNLVDLTSSIVGVVEDYDSGIDWSDTVSSVGSQLVTVFDTPVDIHYQEEENGSENGTYTMNYDGGVTLSPNHILSVVMISKGYIYGKGKGKFVSDSEHISDYFISAVLPFNDATPECCMEKYAKWVSGSMGAQGYTGLQNSIGAHVSLWSPWDNLSDTSGDGNININNHIGYGLQAEQCIGCGQDPVTGLNITASGLNMGSGTRPVHFFWDGQAAVANYKIRVYNASGVLINTINTNDTTTVLSLVPGDYSFTVEAICESGATVISDAHSFTVSPLFLEQEPVKFKLAPNPATDGVTIHLTEANSEVFKVFITNAQGQVFYEASVEGLTHNISIYDWPTGLYFCKVIVNDRSLIKKLIKE